MAVEFTPPKDLPKQPEFQQIQSELYWKAKYQALLEEVEEALKPGKNGHVHHAGLALMLIIEKLIPCVQDFNLRYTQAENANAEAAGTYAGNIVRYVSNEYQKAATAPSEQAREQDAYDAMIAERDYSTFVFDTGKTSGGHDPFGSMGQSVDNQLFHILDGHVTGGNPSPSFVKQLADEWEDSWENINNKQKPTPNSGNSNSIIMQDINGAENQVQSQAAYVQSEQKIANEGYQQLSALLHDVAQNFIDVIKATVTAGQSAGS
ncbi:MAG: hypothetical protein KDK76_02200 [Chlamydiia bacterium]|nr:hypothetical protein [Chlamydiia bacterium]